jgi:hypothetical protein
MWGAQKRYAPWYRELNIMNRMLNKDDCPESYQNCIVRPFSDVFYPGSLIQGIPVIIPETDCSGVFSASTTSFTPSLPGFLED